MPIKYCIFDIGNVCYHYNFEPFNKFVQEQVSDKRLFDKIGGFKFFDFSQIVKGKITFSEFSKNLCKYFNIPYSKKIEQALRKVDHDCIGSLIPETQKLMKELSDSGFQICLLSNITPDLADIVPKNVDKDKRFLSYEIGMIKPNKDIYQYVLKKLGAKPQEILFIDDSPENVLAAQSLEMNGIVFHQDTIISDVQKLCF